MKKIIAIFLVVTVLIQVGCLKKKVDIAPANGQVAPLHHVIRYEGETIAIIAKWYSGDAKNWQKIVDANEGMEPTKITVGDSITIPGEIIKTREDMPKSYLTDQLKTVPQKKIATSETSEVKSSPTPTPTPESLSPTTEELIKTRDDLWRELMGE